MEKQEAPGEQQQQNRTDMTWAGPAKPADARATQPDDVGATQPADARATQPADARATQPADARATQPAAARATQPAAAGASPPDGADRTARMELAAEPSPDLRHLPAGELPQATTYPYPEPERVLVVAIFDNTNAADDCAEDLGRRGLDVAVRLLTDPNAREEAGAQADEQVPPRRLGGRVALGATLGATVGLLASAFVVPEAATGVPSMLTTLVGAGLGSYWGRQAGGVGQQAGAGGNQAAAQERQQRVLLVTRVDEDQADAVQDRIMAWNPVEVRVQ